MFRSSAFTLIELLVVVTIIVVLLALLTPALDRAIYSAELAVCAAKVAGIADAANMYATSNKRTYPNRNIHKSGMRPHRMWLANGSNPPYDERPLIRPYVASINKQFQCPFLTEMSIDVNDINGRVAGETAWASYQFWYGWRFTVPGANERGMNKLGDRWTWTADGKVHEFSIIANDYDQVSEPQNDNFAIGSHPDQKPAPTMQETKVDNEPYVSGLALGSGARNVHIWSRWEGPYYRGTLDMNFAYADGSVNRLNDVVVEQSPGVPDERMVRVAEGNNDNHPTWRNHLPIGR